VRGFTIDRAARVELDEAAGWYEREREGLGSEFVDEVDRTLARIEIQEKFATAHRDPTVRSRRGREAR